MDAHFREYLGAVAGMAEVYGEPPHATSEFHPPVDGEAHEPVDAACPVTATPAVEPAVVAEVREAVATAETTAFAKAV